MNILIISQCRKNALVETRRILDQFAERRGDRTWQTAITQQGLDTLYRLLRQSARRNTAVACHRLRGTDRSELLWVVGDASQFNAMGAVPTDSTARDILRSDGEDDWLTGEEIRLLAALAALFHDFGKASAGFQAKLLLAQAIADAYRHEWVSVRLFAAFVNRRPDAEWLADLTALPEGTEAVCLARLVVDQPAKPLPGPFKELPPLAQVVAWLMLSHHRLPNATTAIPLGPVLSRLPGEIAASWCGARAEATGAESSPLWSFPHGLPWRSQHWQRHARRVAGAILARPQMLTRNWLDEPYALHLARLGLMLADHHYSSLPSLERYGDCQPAGDRLYANSQSVETPGRGDKRSAKREYKQRLDEHLIGVEVTAGRVLRSLFRLEKTLPRIARHRGLRSRSKDAFAWQNKAADTAASLRERAARQGFFGVNMASTGKGKTLANGRILYALADPARGARFTIALGLRTLTLQTGAVYRDHLKLGEADLAVLVGSAAVRQLHELGNVLDDGPAPVVGSESSHPLLPENSHVHFAGNPEHGPVNDWMNASPAALKLVNAPVLVCTIDHLMPATEGTRGGHQIAPMLRLLSADLVLDEPDDFSMEDLPALARLVHWAGLLGSRVLLSSATLPPALIQGLFQAYSAGRRQYQRHRGQPGQREAGVCCAWFDEFDTHGVELDDGDGFAEAHQRFVTKRVARLAGEPVRRLGEILRLPFQQAKREEVSGQLAPLLQETIVKLHGHHAMADPVSGRQVSFGILRLANIDPLIDLARVLLATPPSPGYRFHFCVYHSRYPLLMRAAIERQLDAALDRHDPMAVFGRPGVRRVLDQHNEPHQVFIVAATAVSEVGRDHCYDWGIAEPSSMRAIIQLAGRIRRHRPLENPYPNLVLLDTNLAHLRNGPGKAAFRHPGFELGSPPYLLKSHQLSDLLSPEQVRHPDATSRIQEAASLHPEYSLVDLEHARLHDAMMSGEAGSRAQGGQRVFPIPLWWTTRAPLTALIQHRTPFRGKDAPSRCYGWLPDDSGGMGFYRFEPDGRLTPADHLVKRRITLPHTPRVSLWGADSYAAALDQLAEALDLAPEECARRFGTVDLPTAWDNQIAVDQAWQYHDLLGFQRER